MLPAVGQGTLAVEAREDDAETGRLARAVEDPETRRQTLAERTFLAEIGGACTAPLAAHAWQTPEGLRLDAFVATPDGARTLRDSAVGDPAEPEALGRRLAARLLEAGAADIVRAGRTW
jgi:hydroxymethylbilane synthase